MESTRAGSTTARFPCTHLGSIGLSQGLLLGNRQTMRRQPPSCLAWRLWAVIHSCTAWLTCQEALSQMSTRGPFALGRKVCGQPREKGAGHRADGTSPHKAQQHVVGGRHIETITSHGFALGVLGGYRFFHQTQGLVVAPGMHVRLGFTAPPHFIFEA